MTNFDIAGRVAFVTGAAGGIGRILVKDLLGMGLKVIAIDYDTALLDALRSNSAESGNLFTHKADVRDYSAIHSLVDRIESEMGEIDICVNVAGALTTGLAVDTAESEWDRVFDINAKGVFNVCGAVSKHMIKRKSGSIVTVSSNAAGIPRHSMAAYSASKAAATMFTRSLGLELAEHGIRCNVVAPGSTRTVMQESMWNETTNENSVIAGTLSTYKNGIPLRKIAEPQDIVNSILFLLSTSAGHITMAEIYVDGGATMVK